MAAQTLTEVAVKVHTDMTAVKPEAVRGAAVAGKAAGETLGDGIGKAADGKLKANRGRFASSGSDLAKSFSGGFSSGIDGTFAKVAATMAARFALMGGAAAAAAPGVGQLVSALVPAAGAALALPAALLAIKAATGVVKIAVMGVGDAISTGFTGTAKEADKALEGLSGNARNFAKQIIGLKSPLTDIKNTISDRFFLPLINDVQPLAQKYLPMLKSEAGDLAGPLGGLAEQLAKTGKRGMIFDTVRKVFEQTRIAAINIRGAIDPLAWSLALLVKDTVGELPKMALGFSSASERFADFVANASETGSITKAFRNGVAVLKDFGAVIGNVGSIVKSVYSAATANGNTLLQNLRELTGQAAAFFRSAEGSAGLRSVFDTLGALGAALRSSLGSALPAISSSIQILAPALVGLAQPAADLVKAIAPLLPFAAGLTAQLVKALTPAIAALSKWLSENETVMKAAVITIGAYVVATKLAGAAATVSAAGGLAKWILQTKIGTNLTRIFTATQYALGVAMRFALGPIGLVLAAIGLLVAGLTYAYKNHEGFRNLVMKVWAGIQVAARAVVDWFVGTALPWLKQVWAGIAAGAVQMWQGYIRPALTAIVAFFRDKVAPAAMWLWQNVIRPAFNGIAAAVKIGIAVAQLAIAVVVAYVRNVLAPAVMWVWKNVFSPAFKAISFVVKVAVAAIRLAFSVIIAYVRNVLAPAFMWLWRNVIVPAFNGWKTSVSAAWGFIKPIFQAVGSFITNKVAPAFRNGVSAISSAWEKLREAARVPVKFVVNSVINPLIGGFNKIAGVFNTPKIDPIKGFAGGGRIPGASSHGRDNLLASVFDQGRAKGMIRIGTGEFVTNTESTEANLGLVSAINRKRGKVTHDDVDPYLDGYRDGGRVGDGFGDFFDKVKGGLSGAANFVANPKKALTELANGALNRLPGGGSFVAILKGMGRKVIEGVIKFIEGTGGGSIGGGRGPEGWQSKRAIIARWFPNLRMISGPRPGARTLSGNRSLHADGLAVDYPPSRPLASRIRAQFGRSTQELITPFQDLNLLHGRPHRYTGAVWNQHNFAGGNAHVHWGANRGGLVDFRSQMYPIAKAARADFGSVTLARGMNLIENATGQPEPLVTPAASTGRMHPDDIDALALAIGRVVGASLMGTIPQARTAARAAGRRPR
jgi:hypothetical protein